MELCDQLPFEYPFKDRPYSNPVSKYIARPFGSNEMSTNLKRLQNPEFNYDWDIEIAGKIVKNEIYELVDKFHPSFKNRGGIEAKKKFAGF